MRLEAQLDACIKSTLLRSVLQEELDNYIAKGIVRRMEHTEASRTSVWTPLIGRWKPSGACRVITDLRHVNDHMETPRSKATTWHTVLQLLHDQRFKYAATLDVADAYSHLGLSRQARRWIRAKGPDGTPVEWLAMPFGIQCGAYWCARLFKPWIYGGPK